MVEILTGQSEKLEALNEIRDLIQTGISLDGTRITSETKKKLLPLVAAAEAICFEAASAKIEIHRVFFRLAIAIGEAGFYGDGLREIC